MHNIQEKGLGRIAPSLQEHQAFVSLVTIATAGDFISEPHAPLTDSELQAAALAYTHTHQRHLGLLTSRSVEKPRGICLHTPKLHHRNLLSIFSFFYTMSLLCTVHCTYERASYEARHSSLQQEAKQRSRSGLMKQSDMGQSAKNKV